MKRIKFLTGISGAFLFCLALGATCENQGVNLEAKPRPGARVKQVSVPEPNQVTVNVSGRVDTYAFVLSEDPLRIALDIKDAELSPDAATTVAGQGIIESVDVTVISDVSPPAVRVVANLSQPATYEVNRVGGSVKLKIEPAPVARPAEKEIMPYDETKKEVERMMSGAPPPPSTGSRRPSAYGLPEGDFIPPFIPAMPPANADGSANTAGDVFFRFLADGAVQILIYTNGEVREFVDFDLARPPRLVVDLWGVSAATPKSEYGVDYGAVKRVRIGDHGDKTRAVIDFKGSLPAYDVQRSYSGVVVTVYKGKNAPGTVNGKTRVTVKGESLRSIALEEYGNGDCWPRLLSANRQYFTREELEMIRKTDGSIEVGEGLEIRVPIR